MKRIIIFTLILTMFASCNETDKKKVESLRFINSVSQSINPVIKSSVDFNQYINDVYKNWKDSSLSKTDIIAMDSLMMKMKKDIFKEMHKINDLKEPYAGLKDRATHILIDASTIIEQEYENCYALLFKPPVKENILRFDNNIASANAKTDDIINALSEFIKEIKEK